MDGSDRIVSMLYTKINMITSITYSFCVGESVFDDIENIKEIIEDFNFQRRVWKNQNICNNIQ